MKTLSFPLMALVLGMLSHGFAASTDPWVNSNYLYRVALTNLSPAVAGTTLTDFPVLVAITNADWFVPAQASGGDITFAGVDGQQMFHEVEYFGRSGGLSTLQAWVCVPSFTNQTTIYIYWGNNSPSLTFEGSNSTFALSTSLSSLMHPAIQTNTWDSNYVAVLHLNDPVSNGGIYAKDSSRFQSGATTPAGTNVVPGQTGIGVGIMGTSTGATLALGSTNIKNGSYGGYSANYTRGIFLDKFNNNPGFAAYDRLSSSGGGNLTASLWARWLSAPSNQATWNGTNWGFFTNNASVPVMAIKEANMIGDTRSYQYLLMRATNNFARTTARGIGSDPSGPLAATNLSTIGGNGLYSNWFRYVATTGTIGTTFYHTNWVNDRVLMSASGTPNSGTSSPRGVYVAGADGDYTAGGYHHFSPHMVFDEYRLSMSVRSSNWLLNEYSNVVTTTNMALANGAVSGMISCRDFAAITNVTGLMIQGNPLIGAASAAGLNGLRLVMSNGAAEVYNELVTATGVTGWSATPLLPMGTYTAVLVGTNLDGLPTNSTPVTLSMAIPSTLAVKTINPIGESMAGARITGPLNNFGGVRIYTNDITGTVTFASMLSGMTYTFTNFTPGLYGMPAVVTNITMPTSNFTLLWVVQVPTAPQVATNGDASSRADARTFFPGRAPYFTLSVPSATNSTVRVLVSAIPLSGGRKTLLFDGTVAPSFPYAQIPSEDLKRFMTPGTWIIEMSFPATYGDSSLTPVSRRLLFYGQ